MDVTVLGPQRRTAGARATVAELIPTGTIATVNAGWRERESADAELNQVLDGRMVNLGLYARWQELVANDEEYAAAERRLTDGVDELQAVYALRLHHAVAALDEVNRRDKMPSVRLAAVVDGIRSLRALDDWHLSEVAGVRGEFYSTIRLGERPEIQEHRRELAEIVSASRGLVIAGGHVGVLLHLLHVFGLAAMIRPPVITWSAGAMALSDRVVLFGAHLTGRRLPEVWAEGLGIYHGVLPFPYPRHRLPMHDPYQLALLARRFWPRTCVLFDPGVRTDLRDNTLLPPQTTWIDRDGAIVMRNEEGDVKVRAGVPVDESGQPVRRPADADPVTARTVR
ncbi:MAG: hypothetical protein L0H41_16435 [Microlunatus sp.]|nr:hypothetical protein [Microlunatus sp.]MDN5770186.1 hypothetical protein [Microlunatus sp.]MDN5803860.1 hypothetical protein [Microlunatus sp.]